MLNKSEIKLSALLSQKSEELSISKPETEVKTVDLQSIDVQSVDHQSNREKLVSNVKRLEEQVPVPKEDDLTTIETLFEQIFEGKERLQVLNKERNLIHKSLRQWRDQLDGLMKKYHLEVISKDGREYRK